MGKLLFGPACAALALFYFTILNQCLIESTALMPLEYFRPSIPLRNNPECDPGQLQCLKPNEEIKCFQQAAACYQSTCASLLRPRVYCRFLWPRKVAPHCGCKPEYFYNKNGECVSREECTAELKCDRPNFRVRSERTGCDNNTCAKALATGPRPCAHYIQKTTWCDCEHGFFRNSIGDCVTKQECADQCEKPNFRIRYEKRGCDNNTCETAIAREPLACAMNIQKIKWCDCKPGFFRNSKGDCIARIQCLIEKYGAPCDAGDLKCTKSNEQIKCYHEAPPCFQTTCESLFRPRAMCKMAWPRKIQPQCGCKPGYYYNKDGECVTRQQCHIEKDGESCDKTFIKCGDPNGEVKCNRNPCIQDTCEGVVKKWRCRDALPLEKGAYCGCKSGFYKNSAGKCVTRAQCDIEVGQNQ